MHRPYLNPLRSLAATSWLSRDLLAFSFTSFFSNFCHEMSTALLPTFVQQFTGVAHAPLALGIITGFADAASSAMKLVSGWLSHHIINFKPFVVLGYFVITLFVSLTGTATYIWQVFIYQALAWMGRGLREPLRDVWLTNISLPQYYGKVFGLERALDTLGAIAGPLVAFFTIQLFTMRFNYAIAFIPGIISVLIVLFFTSNYKAPSIERVNGSFMAHLRALPNNFNYFVLVMFIFGISNFHKTLIMYRAQEVFQAAGNSTLIASSRAILLYVLFNVVRSFAELCSGSISDFINRKFIMSFGYALFSIVTLCMIFAKANMLFWLVIFVSAGLSAGIITAVGKSYTAELLPIHVRGIGFGFLQSMDGVANLLASIVIGALWSNLGHQIAFLYAFILSLLSSLLILLLKR
ncbi:MAG: MFS transporter [Candidatus Babeliales bacterium]